MIYSRLLLYSFFRGVFNRLHRGFHPTESYVAINVDATTTVSSCDPLNAGSVDADMILGDKDNEHLSDEKSYVRGAPYLDLSKITDREKDNYDELKEIKDLIKSAALWLSERDADNEARGGGGIGGNGGGGRGRGIKRK